MKVAPGRPSGAIEVPAGVSLSCGRCGRACRARELDRHLWCEECIAGARAQASGVGWKFGSVLAAVLAGWIYFVQRPSAMLIGGWIGAVLATFWLGARAGKELWYGVLRFRHRPR